MKHTLRPPDDGRAITAKILLIIIIIMYVPVTAAYKEK